MVGRMAGRPQARIDHVVGGIHRISTLDPEFGITLNRFRIDDERPFAYDGRLFGREVVPVE